MSKHKEIREGRFKDLESKRILEFLLRCYPITDQERHYFKHQDRFMITECSNSHIYNERWVIYGMFLYPYTIHVDELGFYVSSDFNSYSWDIVRATLLKVFGIQPFDLSFKDGESADEIPVQV